MADLFADFCSRINNSISRPASHRDIRTTISERWSRIICWIPVIGVDEYRHLVVWGIFGGSVLSRSLFCRCFLRWDLFYRHFLIRYLRDRALCSGKVRDREMEVASESPK